MGETRLTGAEFAALPALRHWTKVDHLDQSGPKTLVDRFQRRCQIAW